jgi:hypothetical protein
MRPAAEEAFDGEGGGAECDCVGTEASQLDQRPGEGMSKRMQAGRCADGGEHLIAEQKSCPPAQDDPLWVEEINQIRDADAEVPGRVIQHLRRPGRGGIAVDQGRERGLLIIAGQRQAVSIEDSLGAHISLKASPRPAPAGTPARRYGGVPPLRGA